MSKKTIVALVALLVIVVAVGAMFAMRPQGSDGIEVETEPASTMQIVQTVTATGRIQPKTQVNISADVSAKITALHVQEGQWVDKGDLLISLDREKYAAASESVDANLRVAQSNSEAMQENVRKLEKDLERVQELHAEGLETQAALDSAYASFRAEKAHFRATLDQVDQARANVKESKDELSKTKIYAPMSGTISELNKEVGEIALGSQFQEDVILVLSNLAGMEALVDVDENDVVRLSLGDEAFVEVDALPGTRLPGLVTEIANSATVSGTGTTDQKTEFEVKVAVVESHPDLRPGMTATAEITTDVREAALGVPIQAVAVRTLEQLGLDKADVGDDDGVDGDGFLETVFVVQDGIVAARRVRSGIQSETHIEIIDGLQSGDQVVIGSYRAISRDLQDGSRVIVEAKDPGQAAGGAGRSPSAAR